MNCWNNLGDIKHSRENNNFLINLFLKFKLFRKNISLKPYVNKKFEPFTNFELKEIKSRLEKVDPKFKKIKVKLLGEDLIKVSK